MSHRQPPLLLAVTRPALRGAFRLLGGCRIRGLENLPAKGGAIVAPNHLSWADPPVIQAAVNRRCWFMANHDLFENPALRWWIPYFGAFPVHRGTLDRDAIRRAEGHLKDGDLICVFPEGGTTITGTLYPFEGGVAMMSLRTEVPIVPVAITGTQRVMGEDLKLRYAKGGVTVTFGKPISPADLDPGLPRRQRVDELTQQLYDAVAALLPPEYLPAQLYHYSQKAQPTPEKELSPAP